MVTNNAANNPTAATGKVLQGAGVGTASAFSTATYPATATGTGTILRADGTNWAASTATYPDTAGTSGNVLTSNGTNWTSATPASSGGTLGTPTTASGATVLFTGLPAGAKLIMITFAEVSVSGTDSMTLQLGSGSLTTSNYHGYTTVAVVANAAWSTFAYITDTSVAATLYNGIITMALVSSATNTWAINVQNFSTGISQFNIGAGSVALAGAIDRFQIACSGANTYDNGVINYVAYT